MTKIKNKHVGSSPMKFLQFVPMALQVGKGIYDAFQGGKQRRDALTKAEGYETEFQSRLDEYASEEFVNPYAGMQNVYEDMTIDQRAAEFQQNQLAQQQADTLQSLRGARGSAGAAALASAMSIQGAKQARRISADIGKQEQAIQKAQLGEASRIQGLQMQGEDLVRQQERQRNMVLAQVASGRGQLANQEALAGQQQMMGGITSGLSALGQGFLPGGPLSGLFGSGNKSTVADIGSINNPQVDYGDSVLFKDLNLTPFKP